MVDWPGLLKWTLANTDGTTLNKDLAPMDTETKKWLEEALESFSFDAAKRMKDLIAELNKPETEGNAKEEEYRVAVLDELAELVEGLENARDLVRMGIYDHLVNLMLNSKHAEVRKTAYLVFASCNSNNTFVQIKSLELGAFKLINSVIQEESVGNKEAAFAALSSLVRGEHLAIKRIFIDMEGIEFLMELFVNDKMCTSTKIRTKAMTLLYDLIFYDDKLDYVSIEAFNSKDGLQEKKVNDKSSQLLSLKKEKNAEEQKGDQENVEVGSSGENQDLSSYKNIVKKKLIEKGFLNLYSKYLSKENPKALMDLRKAYFFIVINLIQYDPSCLPSKEFFDQVSDFAEYLKGQMASNDNLFDQELELVEQLVDIAKKQGK